MKKVILLATALFSVLLTFAQNNRNSAEVFIQIQDRGSFTVYLDDELIGSQNGRFRFYDVYAYAPTLTIIQANKKIFTGKLQVQPDQRLVLYYSMRTGLKVGKRLNIYQRRQYALDDFENYIEPAAPTNTTPSRPSRPNHDDTFDQLLAMLKQEPFDDTKIKLVQSSIGNSSLTTAQAIILLETFRQEDQKLTLAKLLYPQVIDKAAYFAVKDSFTFNSTKEAFLSYLNSAQTAGPRNAIRPATFVQLKESVKRETFDNDRTKLIEAAIKNAAPSTAQIGELLKLYTFEDKALICAKMAYPYVSDPQRYFTLKDGFKFTSNQNSFLDFLAQP